VDVNQLSRDRLKRVEPPLISACRLGNLKIASLLVDRGVDTERLDGENRTALWMAAHQRNPDIVSMLVERGASVNPSTLWFRSPLFAAFRIELR